MENEPIQTKLHVDRQNRLFQDEMVGSSFPMETSVSAENENENGGIVAFDSGDQTMLMNADEDFTSNGIPSHVVVSTVPQVEQNLYSFER
jgi:hypothetical protein